MILESTGGIAVNLLYDTKNYILRNGNIAEKLRITNAGFDVPSDTIESWIKELESLVNNDGGVPFDFQKGNPSSVKVTAEVLPLILKFEDQHSDLVKGMIQFLVSRQKNDGGFAETLNLDALIEDKYGSTWGRDWYPVGKSITWLTGKALEALCLAGYENTERLRRARDFLMYSQNEDGHWPDYIERDESDPLGTGNILPALREVDVPVDNKVYEDARAALLHHLASAVENKSVSDMVDLTAVGPPKNDKEREVLRKGMDLISKTQNEDGGWSLMGSKKSDPELSSLLAYVANKCC